MWTRRKFSRRNCLLKFLGENGHQANEKKKKGSEKKKKEQEMRKTKPAPALKKTRVDKASTRAVSL